MSEEQEDLNLGQQFLNFWSGADFLLHWLLAIPWTLQMWAYQWRKAQAEGKRWFPELPKSILVNDTDCRAQDILNRYRIHNMHFGNSFEDGGQMEHAILLPATQYDYADAILHQHGVAILSGAGNKRGYALRPPRDYSERRPVQRTRTKAAKLGKTYN